MTAFDYNSIWVETLEQIERSQFFAEDTFKNWIRKTTLFNIEGTTAYVSYRSKITFQIVNEQKELFEQVLSEVWGETLSIQFVEFSVMKTMMPEEILQQRTTKLLKSDFNPDYTFENFIEGKSNQEAYAACVASCTQTKHLFNPIMLYGNSGLGKTHLLHAIGNYLKKDRPEVKIFYSYSGDLVSILLDAMKAKTVHGNTVDQVQSQLIDNDYFLIDDIQNLTQSSSQEVFFKIYNSLIDRGAQIVITSDMHPNQLKGIQNRLVSRFQKGLVVNIQRPEFDTSRAILKKKLEGYEEACPINEETIDFLAQKFSDDVRSLEGILNRLIFNAMLENPDVIDLPFAQRVLSDTIIVSTHSENLSIKDIKKAVTMFYGLSYKDVEGHTRIKRLATARHMIVYLSHELLDTSWTQIGYELGKRDHSTIKSSYNRAVKLLKSDEAFQMAMNKIKEGLQ